MISGFSELMSCCCGRGEGVSEFQRPPSGGGGERDRFGAPSVGRSPHFVPLSATGFKGTDVYFLIWLVEVWLMKKIYFIPKSSEENNVAIIFFFG